MPQPHQPAAPANTPAAGTDAAILAARAEGARLEAERRSAITAAFAAHLSVDGMADVQAACLNDTAVTLDQANAKILAQLAKGATPLTIAKDTGNIHHFLVGAQGAMPVDAAGNPWSGSYVYNSGNLVLDLLYNLMLESTGRLQKCRIYEMTDNKTARSTIAYLIVRDQAHENAFAKALESLGVNWGSVLPIPKTNAEQFPEVKKLVDRGLQSVQYTFDADGASQAAKLYRGASPSNDGTELSTAVMPDGVPITIAPERKEEFSPGLDPELLSLIQATAEVEIAAADAPKG